MELGQGRHRRAELGEGGVCPASKEAWEVYTAGDWYAGNLLIIKFLLRRGTQENDLSGLGDPFMPKGATILQTAPGFRQKQRRVANLFPVTASGLTLWFTGAPISVCLLEPAEPRQSSPRRACQPPGEEPAHCSRCCRSPHPNPPGTGGQISTAAGTV